MERSKRKVVTSVLVAVTFLVLPLTAAASPLNIVSTPMNTGPFGHNAVHDGTQSGGQSGNILAWMDLDITKTSTFDPADGSLLAHLDVFTTSSLATHIGKVSLTGTLPGDKFNGNTGNIIGKIKFAFNLNATSALYQHLNNKGQCGNIVGSCMIEMTFLDKNFGTTPQGRRFNSWNLNNSGDLVLWGADGYDEQLKKYFGVILGADLVFNTVIPEPATMALLGSGLFGLVGFRRKRA